MRVVWRSDLDPPPCGGRAAPLGDRVDARPHERCGEVREARTPEEGRMSAYMVPEVWCDNCLHRVPADAESTIRELRASLKAQGWKWHPGSRHDICPDCVPLPLPPVDVPVGASL